MRSRLALAVIAAAVCHVELAAADTWYWCEASRAYYPWVQTCPVPWRAVNPATDLLPHLAAPQPSATGQPPPMQAPTTTQSETSLVAPSFAAAQGDALDDFCKTVTLPRTIALCSDAELRALTIERQKTFDEARSRLNPAQQKELLANQNDWVKTYPQACGLASDTAPSLPLAPAIKNCMAQAGRARIAYLRAYHSASVPPQETAAQAPSSAPSTPTGEPSPEHVDTPTALPRAPAAPAPPPSADRSGEPASGTSEQLPMLVIGAVGVIGVIMRLLYKNYKKRVLTEKVMKAVYTTINQHKRALVRKRFQTLRHDDYGNLLIEPWQKELSYFLEKVLDPAIRLIGPEEYALYETMRPALLLTIAHLIEQQAGSSESFTLGPNLTPTGYEQYCAEQLRLAGWSADTTKVSGDQGTDIIAQKGDLRLVVQCKLYNHPVGNKAVQEVSAARAHEQADCAAVVSNSRYTYSAQQLASTNGVLLLHHSDLRNIDDLLSA